MKPEELEGWRRTHYSTQVTPELDGKEVTVFGWVASLREQGGIAFLIIQDKDGILQVTARRDEVGLEVWRKILSLKQHCCVGVRGRVRSIRKAPHGAEVVPEEVKVIAVAKKLPPFQLFGRKAPSIDKRLDLRPVDLRRAKVQPIFRIRSKLLKAIREFLDARGFVEVHTPKIIASATEGGAALFPILYYDKEAFLAQSPQLYKEELTMSLEAVYEIGPIFRAEPSRTLRHLSEVVSIDVEQAYVDYNDVMRLLEEMLRYAVNRVRKECEEEFRMLGAEAPILPDPFPRLSYDEALALLKEAGVKVEWGEDISTAHAKKLGEVYQTFYFIVDWPTASKPFYIKPKKGKEEVCEAFDLMHGELEVASGGSRISSKSLLVKRLKEQGLNPRSFEYHLRAFDYGMPPHAGFGMGLERLMMAITGIVNIREVTLFPRDRLRLTP